MYIYTYINIIFINVIILKIKGTVTQQPLTSAEIKKVTDATPTKQDKGDGMSYRPTTFRLMLETKNREVDELKAKHLELKTQLIQLQRKVDENEENERKIESLKKMSKSKDKEVENTKKILEEKKREIVELQSQNEVLQSNLNEKNQEIEQKSLECEELSHEVRQLQSVEKTLAEESLNTKAQQMSPKQAEESNKFRFFSTLFFVVLVCYSYITQDQFPCKYMHELVKTFKYSFSSFARGQCHCHNPNNSYRWSS